MLIQILALSQTSKMPCPSYSTPAKKCKTGSKLAKIPGSVCSGCYARKGNYLYPNVQRALDKRLVAINHPLWVDTMIQLIKDANDPHFRWHDSGDVQDMAHLKKIVKIARALPSVKFWLPTKELKLMHAYLSLYDSFPSNLTVRVSGFMINGPVPTINLPVSSVTTKDQPIPTGAQRCHAYEQGNQCLECRACWDANVKQIDYLKH